MLNHSCNHKLTIFTNGKKVKISFHKKQDRDELIGYFQQNIEDDCQFNKNDNNGSVADYCWSNGSSRRTITLVAQDMATKLPMALLNLYRGQNTSLKNEIRQVLLIIPFQGQSSGSRMLDELITLASKEQLCWLKLKVMVDLESVIQAFQSKKFEVRAIFEEHLLDAQGKRHDVALMMRPI